MGFDKRAWDPTPAQFAGYGVVAAWIFAWLAEFFLLNETDVSGTLREILAAAVGNTPFRKALTLILLGFVAPYLALWGLLAVKRKEMKYKRIAFTVGVIVLTGLLVFVDHDLIPI